MEMDSLDADRTVVALRPRTAEVRRIVSRRIVEFAAELASADLDLSGIADVLEFPDGLGSLDVVQRAGITYRQLDYWTTNGLLATMPRAVEGSGYSRAYPIHAVIKARLMGTLVNSLHLTPIGASDVADRILRDGSADVDGFRISADTTTR
jgi:hypothetical protein